LSRRRSRVCRPSTPGGRVRDVSEKCVACTDVVRPGVPPALAQASHNDTKLVADSQQEQVACRRWRLVVLAGHAPSTHAQILRKITPGGLYSAGLRQPDRIAAVSRSAGRNASSLSSATVTSTA